MTKQLREKNQPTEDQPNTWERLPCGTRECPLVGNGHFAKSIAVLPLISIFFFLLPIILISGKLLSEEAPDKVGFFALKEVAAVFVEQSAEGALKVSKGFLIALLVALIANILRLFLSMWLMEEIYWQTNVRTPVNRAQKLISYVEAGWRFAAICLLYLAVYHVPSQKVNFEWFLLLCYLESFIWDLSVGFWGRCHPGGVKIDWVKKIAMRWLIFDAIGLILTAIYMCCQFAKIHVLVRFGIFAILIICYIVLALCDLFIPVKINTNLKKWTWLYKELLKRNLIVIPLKKLLLERNMQD